MIWEAQKMNSAPGWPHFLNCKGGSPLALGGAREEEGSGREHRMQTVCYRRPLA